jgi:EAL domain-containing protein (putative c-di-GMP-specific phosphodiesterase class I)
MSKPVAEHVALENELRVALERGEFVLHYQPRVEIASRRIVGVEALIRWRSPERGLVPPGQFIPLLEETGLILAVGAWALERAARDYRAWAAARPAPPRIAVNVSAIQLRQRDFVERVRSALKPEGASPGIDLEITESLVMQDVDATIGKLRELRALGVQIAVDDFGTGYSSLAYLARLPVATLKIDRSFVARMLQDPGSMTLVNSIVSLARSLGLTAVAEGVETEEQAAALQRAGCEQMQGYLFSPAVPYDDLCRMLDAAAGTR